VGSGGFVDPLGGALGTRLAPSLVETLGAKDSEVAGADAPSVGNGDGPAHAAAIASHVTSAALAATRPERGREADMGRRVAGLPVGRRGPGRESPRAARIG
jgi:hypothetical protein